MPSFSYDSDWYEKWVELSIRNEPIALILIMLGSSELSAIKISDLLEHEIS